MDTDFQTLLALHWHETLRLDPEAIFGAEAKRLLNRNWGDRIPQPGYVGFNYRPGGLVFVSMNPGGGPLEGLGEEDLSMYEALKRLRDCNTGQVTKSFAALSHLLHSVMQTWKIHKVFVAPVLESSRNDFSNVAYLNLLKWRTKKSSNLRNLYKLSWNNHTKKQVELLQPSDVVAIGADAGREFRRYYTNDIQFQSIPRVIGNNIGQPGRDALGEIKKWYEGVG